LLQLCSVLQLHCSKLRDEEAVLLLHAVNFTPQGGVALLQLGRDGSIVVRLLSSGVECSSLLGSRLLRYSQGRSDVCLLAGGGLESVISRSAGGLGLSAGGLSHSAGALSRGAAVLQGRHVDCEGGWEGGRRWQPFCCRDGGGGGGGGGGFGWAAKVRAPRRGREGARGGEGAAGAAEGGAGGGSDRALVGNDDVLHRDRRIAAVGSLEARMSSRSTSASALSAASRAIRGRAAQGGCGKHGDSAWEVSGSASSS
jgi:hypothetical protein